jgi:arylsulfatase A-like enzyme
MVEHDGMVGQLLQQLDDLKITDNTIVLYTTDNGAEIAALAGRGDDNAETAFPSRPLFASER